MQVLNYEYLDASGALLLVHCEPAGARVDSALAQSILARHPGIAHHYCKEAGRGHFGSRIEGTSLAHLLEHLSIEYLLTQVSGQVAAYTKPVGGSQTGNYQLRIRLAATLDESSDDTSAAPALIEQAVTEALAEINALM